MKQFVFMSQYYELYSIIVNFVNVLETMRRICVLKMGIQIQKGLIFQRAWSKGINESNCNSIEANWNIDG